MGATIEREAFDILTETCALLRDGRAWTVRATARDKNGCIVAPEHPTAVKWCVTGAVVHMCHRLALSNSGLAMAQDLLLLGARHVRQFQATSAVYVNDNLGHREVMRMLDYAVGLTPREVQ